VRRPHRLLVLDLAVKAALVALLLFGGFSGLERFEGKAMTGRALTYPLATLIVPVVWRLSAAVVFGLAAGFGAITLILWEIAEYFAFIRDNPDEYRTAYTDTIGDLGLSLAGSVLAALLLAVVVRRRSSL
jgi:hypothetical protein